jgi:hypothetical protein
MVICLAVSTVGLLLCLVCLMELGCVICLLQLTSSCRHEMAACWQPPVRQLHHGMLTFNHHPAADKSFVVVSLPACLLRLVNLSKRGVLLVIQQPLLPAVPICCCRCCSDTSGSDASLEPPWPPSN